MKYAMLFLLAAPCAASEVAVVLDAWSWHKDGEWNEHNRSIGVEYYVEREGWQTVLTAVRYEDSFYRDSLYGGVGMMKPFVQGDDWEITGGAYLLYFWHDESRGRLMYTTTLSDGTELRAYATEPGEDYFAPVPGLSFRYRGVGANLALLPPLDSTDTWAAALQFKVIL